MNESPGLGRLNRIYGMAAIGGIPLIVGGLGLGLLGGRWDAALVTLVAGGVTSVLSLLGWLRGKSRVERLRAEGSQPASVASQRLERTARIYGWGAVVGVVVIASGVAVGILIGQGALASAMVAGGMSFVFTGLLVRHRLKVTIVGSKSEKNADT